MVATVAISFIPPPSSSDVVKEDVKQIVVPPVQKEMPGTTPDAVFDERDKGTPDEWIPRHPALIRLTGRHPFNCEPPLPLLMDSGFITPTSIHYVRNHGAVPQLHWDKHTVTIGGDVSKPRTFTMAQLTTEFPIQTFPVTLVCAGNRRKEMNMIKQSIGFNWGAAAVSTAEWRGVLLRDVLRACGAPVTEADGGESQDSRFVCFEGVEDLPKGFYGTSMDYEVAMDPRSDVLLAFAMNGQPLTPDHGFPIRLVIPGFIGGRMIKWLGKINVTTRPSESHYHFHDKRVLPPNIDLE
eukprot:Colp12_sorted_trinity150504_noHs@35332